MVLAHDASVGEEATNSEIIGDIVDSLQSLIAALEKDTQPTVYDAGQPLPILAQADALQAQFQQAYQHFTNTARETHVTSYAGEWFLDNYYIIQQAAQQVREDMPPEYYRQLPKLRDGNLAGYPRIYVLAHGISQFLNYRLTVADLNQFITRYQERIELTTAELWAFPTMLRVVALETLSEMLGRLLLNGTHTHALIPSPIQETYSDDANPDLIVGNGVMSLRAINMQNWNDFFESVSHVDAILRQDSYGMYKQMDFETRNRYRWVVEQLAKYSDQSEEQIASTVVELAALAARDTDNLTAYLGYYLFGEGLAEIRKAIGYRQTFGEALKERLLKFGFPLYIGSISIISSLVVLAALIYTNYAGGSLPQLILSVVLSIIPAITFAVHIVNYIATRIVPPRILPKLDFSSGIPESHRTMVVIPALLDSAAEVDSLIKQLQQHYLRNPDSNLFFAILADYPDADSEKVAGDDDLREQAIDGIRMLNTHYAKKGEHPPFYFFLRRRQWNPSEAKWMGYERKRGKLGEFNRLILQPDAETSYIVKLGDLTILPSIRYVITLDADTVLPRDAARRLVGVFAHPLNQARFDANGRLTSGYTILQPRVEVLPTVATQTAFTRIFSDGSGLDLYTIAVSDIYNDLFAEGIYVGKGIYDVAAFERTLQGKVPDNALLSHDLFEGLNGRATLVTDVILFEDHPTHYLAHIGRIHRWVRGDWQLLPWLRRGVPTAEGGWQASVFTGLDLWKIIDNLRRSLIQPMFLLLILASWLVLPGSALLWTGSALFIFLIPFLIGLARRLEAISFDKSFGYSQRQSLWASFVQWILSVVFLPYEAFIRLDAILTTLYRLWRREHLLEWTPSASVSRWFQKASNNTWRQMAFSLIIVTAITTIAIILNPSVTVIALPMLFVWWVAPLFADLISRPLTKITETLSEEQRLQLRSLARRTWLFFEEFVGPDDNWLPPDHYQQAPVSKVGHYTSPTNMGLMLLSTLAAYDLGYIGMLDFVTRLQFSFESIQRLERYQGHLLNWYNTQNLQPLLPRYVSTVDNGNFAGSLLVLKQGCEDLWMLPILREERWHSIHDTLLVLSQIIEQIIRDYDMQEMEWARHTQARLASTRLAITLSPHNKWIDQLDHFMQHEWQPLSESIVNLIGKLESRNVTALRDVRIYLSRLRHHLDNMRRDLDMLLPWHTAFRTTPPLFTQDERFRDTWQALRQLTAKPPLLTNIRLIYQQVEVYVRHLQSVAAEDIEAREWCEGLITAVRNSRNVVAGLLLNLRRIREQIETEFHAMDFGMLYDKDRNLFHIGYNVDAEKLDGSYYDLLASEARLASFLAIARREVPLKHWLQLSRPVTQFGNRQLLLSWSGTMFEYLMPLLFMKQYAGTLLHQSHEAVVDAQIQYAHANRVPWGISESGYYAFDNNQSYQYRAFGVPTVAFKRGQDRDLVIAPYASLLALPIAPVQVMANIDHLMQEQALTTYGFVEAIDYTRSRIPPHEDGVRVEEFMTHHQGMAFLALANYLYDDVMVRRFHRDPRVESVELLLMEKIPDEPFVQQTRQLPESDGTPAVVVSIDPWEVPTVPAYPQAHYLSNGQYSVMISSGGGGYSQWKKRAITRWRADATLDEWGQWIYIFDDESGAVWSPTVQPYGDRLDWSRTMFHLRGVEFQSRARDISAQLDVIVPSDADMEIRKLRLINHSEGDRQLTICSYGEVVMAPQNSDQRHPAFNKMFIESEYLPQLQSLVFRRRLRSIHDEPMFIFHMLVTPAGVGSDLQMETDRGRFLGRNRTYRNPIVFDAPQVQLSGTTGATLDPIMALAQSITVPPHSTVELAFVTMAGDSYESLTRLAQQFHQWDHIERSYNRSRYDSIREMHNLGVKIGEVALFQKLLSGLLYPNPQLRAAPHILAANTKSQSALWAYGVSGDYPIIAVQVSSEEHLELVYDLLQAHRLWRSRGFACTLVILNTGDTGYMQELYNQIHKLLVTLGSESWMNRHDGIFILRSEQLNDDDRTLLRTAARVFLDGEDGTLQEQLDRRVIEASLLPPLTPSSTPDAIEDTSGGLLRPDDLQFDNGIGGFSANGREYVMFIAKEHTTPAPWINVIANSEGGFIFSEAGGGFSWGYNSGENRMTNWRNDPVTDMPAEAIYLRDEETALVWSPTLMPAGGDAPYLVRHGAGYSVVEHHSQGLRQTITTYAAPDEPVKFVRVRLKNTATRPRRLTVTYYMEWVLGPMRDMTQQYLIPEYDAASQTILAHNPYSMEFSQHYAFLTANKIFHGMTCDRTEFLGRTGTYAQPAALRRLGLSNVIQAGLDPCAVVQLHVDLPVGGEEEVCFVMGSGTSRQQALDLSQQYKPLDAIETAYQTTVQNWRDILDSVIVRTPDPAMNLLLPWLLYQALSCRLWGRSALYQSSGAYGFRDQLQDVMSLIHARPELAREHILRAARHQFEAGDVLHWWHPPSGRGVRTRFSDDLVWLPYVVSEYVEMTGDKSVLDEEVPFLVGEPLRPEEEERYGFYEPTAESYPIYDHCQRALNHSYDLGQHQIPLMKAGDWNDGMNRVGIEGRGESVWMGWFLYTTLERFSHLAQGRGETNLVEMYRERMLVLKTALEKSAWDGEWYRRAYYDDGTPLGSQQNMECQIDSLVQSWSVLSGAGDPKRTAQAMQSVEQHLIDNDHALIRLFTPPFNHTPHDPGYIKGYPPGIRENGGQYSHAALWVIWAFAQMGKGNTAWRLFDLLNPINHTDTPDKVQTYRVEPYVIAADVYSTEPHTGRGGWTWYTGSSGWMYRLGVEAILGLHRQGCKLRIQPATSSHWEHYEIDYRYGSSVYKITILHPIWVENGQYEAELDGENLGSNVIELVDDGQVHEVILREVSTLEGNNAQID